MQNIPDKEFDRLFKDKLIDAEITPSVNLWAKIEKELTPKRKRIIPVYWMAAASIVLVFAATLLFQRTEKIQLRPDAPAVNVVKLTESELPADIQPLINENKKSKPAVKIIRVKQAEKPEVENNLLAVQPTTEEDRLPIKREDVKPINVLPLKETFVTDPVVIAQVEPEQKIENNVIEETDNVQERKGIRNIGDLVNFVVDKVDKREQKFIKFNTDDDDNSSLIGINIGFVKLNKRHR